MSCPDIEQLIALGLRESEDQEFAAHVQDCETCQADLQTIKLLAGVERKEWVLSEEMITEIVSNLPDPEAPKMTRGILGLHLCVTAGLGFLTAIFATVATGMIAKVGPPQTLLLAVAFGTLCMLVNLQMDRNAADADNGFSSPEPV